MKVNGAPEQLGTAVLQHPVCVHIAYGAAPGLQGVIVKVKGAIPGAQVADVCRKAAVVSVQVGLAPGVGGFTAQKQLHQLKVRTGTAVGANVVDHRAVRARQAQLHQSHFCTGGQFYPGLQAQAGGVRRALQVHHHSQVAVCFCDQLHSAGVLGAVGAQGQSGGGVGIRFGGDPVRLQGGKGRFRFLAHTGGNHCGRGRGGGHFRAAPVRFAGAVQRGQGYRGFVHVQSVPGGGRQGIDCKGIFFCHTATSHQPMLPFISKRIKLFISTAYSSGSSLDTSSAKPLTIMARASSSLSPRDMR